MSNKKRKNDVLENTVLKSEIGLKFDNDLKSDVDHDSKGDNGLKTENNSKGDSDTGLKINSDLKIDTAGNDSKIDADLQKTLHAKAILSLQPFQGATVTTSTASQINQGFVAVSDLAQTKNELLRFKAAIAFDTFIGTMDDADGLQDILSCINSDHIKCGCNWCLSGPDSNNNHNLFHYHLEIEKLGIVGTSSDVYQSKVRELCHLTKVESKKCLLYKFVQDVCKQFKVPIPPDIEVYDTNIARNLMDSKWGETITSIPFETLTVTLYKMIYHLILMIPPAGSSYTISFNDWFKFSDLSLLP